MSCDITNGRVEQCKDSVSGLKAIYFANFDDLDSDNVVYDATNTDVIDTWQPAAPLSLYKYELKSTTNSFHNGYRIQVEITEQHSSTQTLVAALKRQDFATHKNVKLLAYGRPRIIVTFNDRPIFLNGS